MSLRDFFTTKTSAQVASDAYRATQRDNLLSNAKGFDSFISDKQKEVDALRNRVDGFLTHIRAHFAKHGLGDYLDSAYNPRTKFDDLENGVRRMGMKWTRGERTANGSDVELAFAFIEEQGEVRVDYMYTRSPGIINDNAKMKVVTDRFIDEVDEENPYRTVPTFQDTFRSVRRYEMYDDFVDEAQPMPEWFVMLMKTCIHPL